MFSIKRSLVFVFVSLFFPITKVAAASNLPAPNPPEQPNIIMIIVDDLRPVIGAYGDEKAHTPNIDRLARQGITFNRAFANVPVCGASRASLLTGLRPTKNRFLDYRSMAEEDAPGVKSLPQTLRESGYRTMAIGKIFHNAKDLADESWSEGVHTAGEPHTTSLKSVEQRVVYGNSTIEAKRKIPWYEIADVNDEDYPDGKVKTEALDALSFLASTEEPFFLSVGFIRPHLPFYAPKKYYDLHPAEKFPPFFHRVTPKDAPKSLHGSDEIKTYSFDEHTYNSDEFHTISQRGYYASVSYVDALIGDVLEQVTLLGLQDDTTIILVSDHGFHLGEHNFWTKHTLLKTALRVPLIISGPSISVKEYSDALIELVDIFPTVLDIAKIPLPKNIDGESFKSVIDDPSFDHKTQIYSRFKTGDSIITKNLILTLYESSGEEDEMLFDLQNDPYETQNMSKKSRYQGQMRRLKAMLKDCKEKKHCKTDQ